MKYYIYKLTNKINGKTYIGQTIDYEERMRQHSKGHKCEHSKNYPLYRAIAKYGWDNFSHEILEEHECSQEEIDAREIELISENNSLVDKNGYNVKLGGATGGFHTEYSKQKIADAQKGEKNHMYGKCGKDNPAAKPVINLTTNTRYECIQDAAKSDNVGFSKITAVCKGRRGSTGGYVYRYLDESGNIVEPIYNAKKKTKRVRCIETGIIYNSVKEARETVPGNPDIEGVCRGRAKTAAGYRWEYIDE